jgi:hypothetical protein
MTALVSAPPDLFSALQRAVAECDPVLVDRNLVTAVTRKVRDSLPGAKASTVGSIIRTLLAVYSSLRAVGNSTASEAAAETVDAVRKDGKLGTPPDGWDAFQARLEQLLSDDKVLGLSSKAITIASDTARHVHGFRVLTDARPVFGQDAKDGPKAFALIHTLKIEYFEGGEDREWFVSLDADDLESLQGAADRALAKERSMQAMLQKLNIPVLSWKVKDNGEK